MVSLKRAIPLDSSRLIAAYDDWKAALLIVALKSSIDSADFSSSVPYPSDLYNELILL